MTGGGSAPQPVVLPEDHGTKPPVRGPEQPPGRWTETREKVIKWGAISIGIFLLVLFVVMATTGYETRPTPDEFIATREALDATREARGQ